MIIDNNEVDIYNSPARPGSISNMFEVNKSGILAVIDFIEKDALDQLVFKDEPLTEASNTIVYRAEYYEPKLGKWVSYYENNSLDSVKSNLDNPIVGDPRRRIAQYERSGVRKPSYKFVKEVDTTLEEDMKYYPQDYDKIELEYKDLEFTQVGNKRDVDDWDEFDREATWTYEVDKNDVYTFIFEDCIDVEDFPTAFDDEFDPNNEDDWNSFVAWLEDNFEEIYSKYEDKILDRWKEDAIEDAEKNYEYDPIDYDAKHDDYKFDESIKGDNMKFKVMNEGLSEREITTILSDAQENSDASHSEEYWIGYSAAAFDVKEKDLFLLLPDHINEEDIEYKEMLAGYRANNGIVESKEDKICCIYINACNDSYLSHSIFRNYITGICPVGGIMKMKQKTDDAVSEVVGVLIMLTVTIILVSVVAVAITGTVSDTEKPLNSQVTATAVIGDDILFELISGDSFTLSNVKVSLGVRENSTASISIIGTNLVGVSGDIISLGDRFRLNGTTVSEGINFGGMDVKKGEHLTYQFFDKSGRPFSSGEIRI